MKKSKIFKYLVLVLVLAMSLALVGCGGSDEESGLSNKDRNKFIDQIGGTSETFTGAVSSTSYSSKEAAAEAFVKDEIVGESDAEILEVTSKAVLKDEEVSKLAIPEAEKEGIVEVEEVEVTYTEVSAYGLRTSTARNAQQKESSSKITVYIIKYETNWKYFVPAPVTGKTITKSYYDSVFDSEKFKNSTYNYEMSYELDIKATYQGETQKMKMKMEMTQAIKYADGKILIDQYASVDMSSLGMEKEVVEMSIYLEEIDGVLHCYMKVDGVWEETNLVNIGFGSLDELTPFANDYLDYTYFTKTDYGFKLDDENAQSYINQVFAQQGLNDILGGGNLDMNMYAEYYVNQGVLSGVLMKADLDMSMSESGVSMKMTGDIVAKGTCTDYGTTVVDKPF